MRADHELKQRVRVITTWCVVFTALWCGIIYYCLAMRETFAAVFSVAMLCANLAFARLCIYFLSPKPTPRRSTSCPLCTCDTCTYADVTDGRMTCDNCGWEFDLADTE